jgi:hypothetical protein
MGNKQVENGKTLKLSEAMREGAKLRPQGAHLLFSKGRSCALGAALEGIGLEYSETAHSLGTVRRKFSILRAPKFCPCPVPNCEDYKDNSLTTIVGHLNDDHEWTRERIADWLETIEVGQ